MALSTVNPSQTQAWQKLEQHFKSMQSVSMKTLFEQDPARAEKFHIQWNDFLIDYSKNRITEETTNLLLQLADEVQLKSAIQDYFSGEIINQTEGRAVLHTALRSSSMEPLHVDGVNIIPEIEAVKNKIQVFSNEVISGQRKGYTGKAFTDVVNIGIGGSDLGPAMVVEALQYYKNHLNVHFVSNVDGDHVQEIIKHLNPRNLNQF